MDPTSKAEIIRLHPIGHRFASFLESLSSKCQEFGLPCCVDSLHQLDNEALRNLCIDLIAAFITLPASRALPSTGRATNLNVDLSRLNISLNSGNLDLGRLIPLIGSVLNKDSDAQIWDKVHAAVVEHTPPPQPFPFQDQTPILHNTSSFVNSSEHRKYLDDILKDELGSLFIGIPGFQEFFFGKIENLEEASKTIFQRCQEGQTPLYTENKGWRDWPESATQNEVLRWLKNQVNLLVSFAEEEGFPTTMDRKIWAKPDQPVQGSTAGRKLDIAFINKRDNDIERHWSQILIPGELKSNPSADTLSGTWLDLSRYVREIFAAQDNRRFVLGFTLCGSIMRLWEFDRMGGIASSPFDINDNGHLLVSALLGFLSMDETLLGFDPTIKSAKGMRYIEIHREGKPERLVIHGLMKRAPCIAGRGTSCWLAHRDGDESKIPLVIKDSWQYPEREEEGILLREAMEKQVVNLARYYHHETVQVNGEDDDIRGNIRRGLDIARATNYLPSGFEAGSNTVETARKGRTGIGSGKRTRSSSGIDASSPPSKRTCSSSHTKSDQSHINRSRVHRRVIVRDYGKPLYRASSRIAMLAAMESCIEGYESLHAKAGLLQGDISTGNLMMNEDGENPSWSGFLIDLDLAIRSERTMPSGAWAKTGTRAFMAIGLLLGQKHSFMHDLESFFWVLFWICIHYNGPSESCISPAFEKWNYVTMEDLATLKFGTVGSEVMFIKKVTENFNPYYEPLIPWIIKLRREVFPMGQPWEKEDLSLYSRMREILQAARLDKNLE